MQNISKVIFHFLNIVSLPQIICLIFLQNLEERGTKTKANINQMLLRADETNIRLDNINNKLSALQHTQFVENRVYEEDETISNAAEVPSISDPKVNNYPILST